MKPVAVMVAAGIGSWLAAAVLVDARTRVEVLFGICPETDPERAARVHAAHLARAKWMTTSGYCELLGPRLH